MKEIISKEDLQDPLVQGMTKIASIVKRTLGPGGLPILIERIGQQLNGDPLGPKITKDGVSVAVECSDPDPKIDLVIQAVKAICQQTNTKAGDGTTSAVVLGEAILLESLKVLKTDSQINPQMLRLEIEVAANKIKEALKTIAVPVKDKNLISKVAAISANGDSDIGDIIGEAFSEVGVDGIITVDEGVGLHTTLTVVDGYQINRGAEARDRFFNARNNTTFEANNPIILVYDGDLNSYSLLISVLEKYAQATKKVEFPPIVLIANDFHPEVITWLLAQKMEIGLTVVPVKGPHTTYIRTGYYDDLVVLLGAQRLGNGNRSLTEANPKDFGTCEKVVVTKYTTTFYNGAGTEEAVLARVNHLRELKDVAESPYDAQLIGERLASLTQGIAKIGVGGATEFEIKEKYDRIEDALNAARAAIQEGVVPGGGCALLRLAEEVFPTSNQINLGEKILRKALQTPFIQILENVGVPSELIQKLRLNILAESNLVCNAQNLLIENFLAAGIVDPVKVTRTALENAVSIATLLSTAGGGIIIKK